MIDPRTIYVAIPCADGRMMAETAASLIRVTGRYGAFNFLSEVSHVSLVRNFIADSFLQSGLEWLVSIDSDINFRPEDWDLLMEPSNTVHLSEGEPEPTRVTIAEVIGRDPAEPSKFLTAQCAADLLVCAEYPFKNDLLEPVKLGMGFVRIHRSVFETLIQLKHPESEKFAAVNNQIIELAAIAERIEPWDGRLYQRLQDAITKLSANLPDPGKEPRLWQMTYKGRLICDFFPSGPILNTIVPTAEWKGEDHGFWTLCYLAGLIPRIERRTRLCHVGRKGYIYDPDAGGGQ